MLWSTLEHLFNTDAEAAEVIVVFNGLDVDWEKLVLDMGRFPRVRLIRTPTPYGIARANNLGFRAGNGKYVAFLHDDVLLKEKGWLQKLMDVLDRRPDIGMVGGSEPKYTDRSPDFLAEAEPGLVECDWSPTISLARRCDLENCFFDESYLVGLEDKDWGLSFRRKSLKVVCRRVLHEHVGTKGSYTLFVRDRALLDYYSKEGVRERYFLTKNKDVLSTEFQMKGWSKWARWDRDWKKTWWMKLYFRSYCEKLKNAFSWRNL